MTLTLPHRSLYLSSRRRLRRETGQTMVEFAVVLPIFILLILGILYFSRYENYSNQETQLAEQGVRWAAIAVNPGALLTPSQSLQNYIASQASPELASGSGNVTKPLKAYIYYPTTGQPASPTAPNIVRVCVTATVTFPTPIGVPSTVIAETATEHVEQQNTSTPPAWTADAIANLPPQCPTA